MPKRFQSGSYIRTRIGKGKERIAFVDDEGLGGSNTNS